MKIFLLIGTLLTCFLGFSQNFTYRVSGKITNSDTKKAEGGVTVSFVSNGKVIASAVTSSNGKYDLKADGPYNGNYNIVYSKAGLVSKKVAVNTGKVNLEDVPAGSEFPLPTLDMDMFGERPGSDFSFLNNEPVASFFWDETKMMLNFDKDASAKTKKKIEDALAAAGNKSAEDEAKYQAAIKAGETLQGQKKYEEALAKYEEASTVKPKEPLPIAKIDELDKLIKAQKTEQLASQQADSEFKNLITAADNLRDQKKYTESIAKYNEALKKKDDAYAKGEIAKINKIIDDQKAQAAKDAEFEKLKTDGMALAGSKKWTEAKTKLNQALAIKADAAVSQKIKDIDAELDKESANKEKTEKFNAAMAMADNLVKSKKYTEAKAKYTEAQALDPTSPLPKQKISDVDALIAKQKGEADKKAKIDKLLADGSTSFTKNDLPGAKAKFEEVLNLEPSNTVATAKLKEVNAKLDAAKGQAEKDAQFETLKKDGMALATAKKYNEAKIKLQQAVDMKPDAAITLKLKEIDDLLKADQAKNAADEEYNRIMSDASTLESSKNYDGAIAKYKEALAKKTTEALPKSKISELEKLKKDAANQTQAETQKAKLYDGYMASGAKNMSDKKYQQALTDYQNALSVKSGDSQAQGKISEIQQILDDLKNAESKNSETQKNFDKLVADADRLFKQEKYLDAKAIYEKALIIKSDDQRVVKQVSECDRLEKEKGEKEGSAEYKKLLSAADKKFTEKDYLKAKEYYERALKIRANDPYPKAKLDEIEKLLNPTKEVVKTNVAVETLNLDPLGVPYTDTQVTPEDALKRAEIERENLKNKNLKTEITGVNDREGELGDQKHGEQLQLTADIHEIKTGIEEELIANDGKHNDVIELEKKVIKEQNDRNTASESLENSDHLSAQEKMSLVKGENSDVYIEKEGVYANNTDILRKHDTQLAVDQTAEVKKYDDASQDRVEGIRTIENKIVSKQVDDTESRIEVEERIDEIVEKAVEKDKSMNDTENKSNLDSKIAIDQAEKKMGDKIDLDLQNAAETGNDLEKIKHDVRESENADIEKDNQEGKVVTAEMVALNKKLAEEQKSNDNQQIASNQVLQQAHKDLSDHSVDQYNDEMVKYLASQRTITDKSKKVTDDTQTSTDKLIENDANLTNITNSIEDNLAETAESQVEKHQGAQQAIHDKQNTVTVEKPVIANGLGAKYPEGVTQESFTQNDENGLMKAIITRRIVVVGGKGDVYVKTQTSNSITFSKNGSPTTERVWQKETQGPNLVKHY